MIRNFQNYYKAAVLAREFADAVAFLHFVRIALIGVNVSIDGNLERLLSSVRTTNPEKAQIRP